MHKMRPNNGLRQAMDIAEMEIKAVALGQKLCMALGGSPGMGKTYLVESTLRDMKVPHRIFRGTGAQLLATLWQMPRRGVIVLDDADNLVAGGGRTQVNLMKQILDPGKRVRVIHNETIKATKNAQRDDPDPEIAPPRFQTDAKIIWISNTNSSNLYATLDKNFLPHFRALVSRGMQLLDIDDGCTEFDKLDYVLDMATTGGVLKAFRPSDDNGEQTLSLTTINTALEFFTTTAKRQKEISIRRIKEIVSRIHFNPSNWQLLTQRELLKADKFQDPLPPVPFMTVDDLRSLATRQPAPVVITQPAQQTQQPIMTPADPAPLAVRFPGMESAAVPASVARAMTAAAKPAPSDPAEDFWKAKAAADKALANARKAAMAPTMNGATVSPVQPAAPVETPAQPPAKAKRKYASRAKRDPSPEPDRRSAAP